MKKTTLQAVIATAALCYLIWICLTGQIPRFFTGDASAQILIAGAVISILIALFASRFFIHVKASNFFKPLRVLKILF